MDFKGLVEVLELLPRHPQLIIAACAIACVPLAWWLRGYIAQGEINALERQVAVAQEHREFVEKQLATVKQELAEASAKLDVSGSQITALRETQLPPDARVRVDGLAKSNTEVRERLSWAAASTITLEEALDRFYATRKSA
jgi:septal ring factor EnvC (AmiA/AmiB activator)